MMNFQRSLKRQAHKLGRTCDHCGNLSNPVKGMITWYAIERDGKMTRVKAHPGKCLDALRQTPCVKGAADD